VVAIDGLGAALANAAFKVATEGRPQDYVSELREKFVPTMLAGYKLWIPAHIINFAFVPNRQRILYANVSCVRSGCALPW
jgi:hypothetical protein